MTPKLLQNRGANEARPTHCFLHLSRNPSNETTSACGWPPPGDPAVFLWASRTHIPGCWESQATATFLQNLSIWGLSILQFADIDITTWTDFCEFSSGSRTAAVAAVSLSLHTYRCETSRELQHLQPAPGQGLGSGAQQGAGGQPPAPSTQLCQQHRQPAGRRRAGMQATEGKHQARAFLTAPLSQSALCFALQSVYLDFLFNKIVLLKLWMNRKTLSQYLCLERTG